MSDRTRRIALVAAATTSVVVAAAGLAATAAGPPSDNPYATAQFTIGLSAVSVGTYVAARRQRHPMGWLLILAGASCWMTFAGAAGIGWMMVHTPEQELLGRIFLHVSISGWIVTRGVFIALVPLAFPDGFAAGRPARLLLWASIASTATMAIAHSRVYTFEHFAGLPPEGTAVLAEKIEPWASRALLACAAVAAVTLVVRTLRSDAEVRRQHRWFVAGTLVLVTPLVVDSFQSVVTDVGLDLVDAEVWTMAALPVVLAVGILRHGLLDLQVVVRRATLYGGVSAVALLIYGASVWVVTTLSADSETLAALVGAGLVAITLGQVRDAVQRAASRHLFGSRDDPYGALAALGARLETAPVGQQALQTVTDTICEELRVPHAAVDLVLDGTEVRVADSGDAEIDGEAFPLSHRGIALGRLLVSRRTEREPFTDGERRLLADLARQTGVLAHNASLTEALRHSRAVLLGTREEERRRIRADLHDGLGPTLATVALGLGAAAERLEGEPELTGLLTDLEHELQTAIADVRALVYDLRPAALDDLGLVSALREHAENLARRTAASSRPLRVEIEAPDDLAHLPAAVEVAAYRVALEALTNVSRHARASSCRIHIDTRRGLALTVEDDGVGIPEHTADGVGVRSMRERVEELGGRFRIQPTRPSGTTVHAWLPLPAGAIT